MSRNSKPIPCRVCGWSQPSNDGFMCHEDHGPVHVDDIDGFVAARRVATPATTGEAVAWRQLATQLRDALEAMSEAFVTDAVITAPHQGAAVLQADVALAAANGVLNGLAAEEN